MTCKIPSCTMFSGIRKWMQCSSTSYHSKVRLETSLLAGRTTRLWEFQSTLLVANLGNTSHSPTVKIGRQCCSRGTTHLRGCWAMLTSCTIHWRNTPMDLLTSGMPSLRYFRPSIMLTLFKFTVFEHAYSNHLHQVNPFTMAYRFKSDPHWSDLQIIYGPREPIDQGLNRVVIVLCGLRFWLGGVADERCYDSKLQLHESQQSVPSAHWF